MCPAEFHDPETGVVVTCEREDGHYPSEWHRSRKVGIVWYVDRRAA